MPISFLFASLRLHDLKILSHFWLVNEGGKQQLLTTWSAFYRLAPLHSNVAKTLATFLALGARNAWPCLGSPWKWGHGSTCSWCGWILWMVGVPHCLTIMGKTVDDCMEGGGFRPER